MDIHEYQAKILLERYGVPVPPFVVCSNEKEIAEGIEQLGLKEVVIKIQVHAGGRGKAGGVKFASGEEEIYRTAKNLLGMTIVNRQTGPLGMKAEKVLLSPIVKPVKEYYVAALIDRSLAQGVIIASSEGGMDIEETAAQFPEKIIKEPISLKGEITPFSKQNIAKVMQWKGKTKEEGIKLLDSLAEAFVATDASLFEINPLIQDEAGRLFALDAKCSIDDNALFRQKEIASWYDPTQSSPNEVLAKEYDLAYVGLTGEIGCLVNGAGLAMATMDIIHYYGGAPANFLDVGGGATEEQIAHGFKIILLDKHVKAIFVNIFGGIMDCLLLAKGIITASKRDGVAVPLVVRMEGTNVEEGKSLLRDSGLTIITADTMAEGAMKAIRAARRGEKDGHSH